VEAAFDGGLVSPDAGARAIDLVDWFASCFCDERRPRVDRVQCGDSGGSAGVRDRARLRGSPILQILSLTLFEKVPLDQLLNDTALETFDGENPPS
jgi:hypothetical protein